MNEDGTRNMELLDKKATVVGLARTGEAVAEFLHGHGARVTVVDQLGEEQLGERAAKMHRMGIALELGPHREALFLESDLIVLSPGVPHALGALHGARQRGVPIIGEVELASLFIREPIVAVTGTNGKTTTTSLVGAMLDASGLKTFVGGNIGTPLILYATLGEKADVVVAEISSFQLDTAQGFHPQVAVLLNITEDHLDRYPGFAAYAYSKARLFMNQGASDVAVLNGADPAVRDAVASVNSRCLYFSGRRPQERGADIGAGSIAFVVGGGQDFSLDTGLCRLRGLHNLENMAAAALAAFSAGATPEGIRKAAASFEPMSHRVEHVATVRGVQYYNDSKATNVDAVRRALESFEAPVVLIMGGRDKGADFAALAGTMSRKVRRLIVMGEARGAIMRALSHLGIAREARDMEDAVQKAQGVAHPGDVVLLSPACASFDRYRDYKERGLDFCRYVRNL